MIAVSEVIIGQRLDALDANPNPLARDMVRTVNAMGETTGPVVTLPTFVWRNQLTRTAFEHLAAMVEMMDVTRALMDTTLTDCARDPAKLQDTASRSGEWHLKARSDLAVIFRNHFFQCASTPVERSSRLVAQILYILEDPLTAGAVSPTRLDAVMPISLLNLPPATVVKLQRNKNRFASSVLLNFIEGVAETERDLLRFDVLQLHLNALDLMRKVTLDHAEILALQFGREFYNSFAADTTYVVGWIIQDRWHANKQRHGHSRKSDGLIRLVAAILSAWAKTIASL
ncbi:hypothetical protein GGF31_002619 [Allomyces arbusculus]|nr:hypothetical protein GGF31_002619 [Allomyces arbusculus]